MATRTLLGYDAPETCGRPAIEDMWPISATPKDSTTLPPCFPTRVPTYPLSASRVEICHSGGSLRELSPSSIVPRLTRTAAA
jgi:hypothetical protein